MKNLEQIKLIQGGMGVYVSNWRLARAVAMERPGVTVGTVSGTALDVVYVRLLQLEIRAVMPGARLKPLMTSFMLLSAMTSATDTLSRVGKRLTARFAVLPCRLYGARTAQVFPVPPNRVHCSAEA